MRIQHRFYIKSVIASSLKTKTKLKLNQTKNTNLKDLNNQHCDQEQYENSSTRILCVFSISFLSNEFWMRHYFKNQVEGICFASTRIGKVLNSEDTKCPRNLKLYHSESLQSVFLQLDFRSNNFPAKYSKPQLFRKMTMQLHDLTKLTK